MKILNRNPKINLLAVWLRVSRDYMDETSNDRYAPSGRQREWIRDETGGENIGPPISTASYACVNEWPLPCDTDGIHIASLYGSGCVSATTRRTKEVSLSGFSASCRLSETLSLSLRLCTACVGRTLVRCNRYSPGIDGP